MKFHTKIRESFKPQSFRNSLFTAYAAALLMAPSTAMAAPMYTITDLGVLSVGDDFSAANGVNDSGQVVGYSGMVGTRHRAFLWTPGPGGGMTDLGDLPAGGDYSFASDINNSGQVVGHVETSTGSQRAFLWNPGPGGGMTDLGDLPGGDNNFVQPGGINDSGQVVGLSSAATGFRAFLWDKNNGMTDLGGLPGGGDYSVASDINNSGQVVGTSSGAFTFHGVLWQNGVMTDLGDLPGGFDSSHPNAINDSGQVVGESSVQPNRRAFLWEGGVMTNLGDLPGGADYSVAVDINDSGQVVGYSQSSTGGRAFLWDEDLGMLDLNDLLIDPDGWNLLDANGINASGQIAGYGHHNGAGRGFLLTPVDAAPQTEVIAPGVHPDREAILNPSSQSGSLNDTAEFSADGQSMWASGDALFDLNWQRDFGPDIQFDEAGASPDGLITASVIGGLKAQLETGLTISSGFLDVDYGYDVLVDYTFDPATGNLVITTGANNPRGNLNTTAPDIAFDLGLDFDFTAAFAADAHILGVTIPLGAVNIAHLESEFSLGHGGLVGNADYCFVGADRDCTFKTPYGTYGSLSLNQLPQSPDISAQADVAGLIRGHVDTASIMAGNGGGDSQTDILSGSLDLDAIGLSLAGLPPQTLGGQSRSCLGGYESANFSCVGGYGSANFTYDVIDADLNIGLGLGQDVSFTPHLMAEITINGQTVTVPVGESFTVNVGPNARNIFLNANYILDNTFTNTVSLAGTLNANATFGAFSAEGDINIPGFPDPHFNFEESLFEYETPAAHGNLFSVFDNSFRVTGFNSHASNWSIDIPDHEAAPVSQFAGAPSSTGQVATNGTVDWQVDGTAFFEGGHIVAQTNSPTLIYTNITLPVDVVALTFDFMAITTVSGDVLKLYFGDIELFSLTGDMFGADWMRTDFIDISAYAGMTDLLTIALLSPTGVHSKMLISNIFFYDTLADIVGGVSSVPEPGTLFLLGTGLLVLLRLRHVSARQAGVRRKLQRGDFMFAP